MRLAAFRRTAPPGPPASWVPAAPTEVALVLGAGEHLRLHPVEPGVSLVALLAAERTVRDAVAERAAASDGLTLDEVVLAPPVHPVAMRDFLTFESHVEGIGKGMQGDAAVPDEWYAAPSFLFMAPHAVHGAYDDVVTQPDTERLDFELELAAVICRDVRNATPEQARAAIGGYCVMNDWSARDVQGREMRLGLGPSKGKDFATTIGPWVVTPDELVEHRDADGFLDLAMTVRVNGVEVGADRSGHMGWSFEQLVSYASRASWVRAGEVLASGTCGTGALAEAWGRRGELTPPPLQVGDVVEMQIEGVGVIRNRVVAGTESVPPIPAARRREREAV
ncbi:fumarylacetoacetate hydrolase family protein [Nocardioides alkalitolerans]|uniref:fumarylacetoacetate hydrolase family protein n=1 Tax=Nocardioides alkalitolerans TaxID=281714 RepID=UPI00040A7C5B|nr:fumarylacetoacetate hydrolase family protein [Nocardioides alkalitolerans]